MSIILWPSVSDGVCTVVVEENLSGVMVAVVASQLSEGLTDG